jgi:uncharacterized membrane protein YoaT (DUF817 family)
MVAINFFIDGCLFGGVLPVALMITCILGLAGIISMSNTLLWVLLLLSVVAMLGRTSETWHAYNRDRLDKK